MGRIEATLIAFGIVLWAVFLFTTLIACLTKIAGNCKRIRAGKQPEKDQKNLEDQDICENCIHSEDRIKDQECVFVYCAEDKRYCSRYGWCADFEERPVEGGYRENA